ncbi:acyltransferase domain-containing protein [Streptomyces sp. AK02-01A]|uniref:acyltransferase domain-containing protein n=1 Tax=Streptomyces sp. AK02-01A TaxID=3028648 RepID=UPI0029AFE09C|nr:acyltransferase domain-containing protein [Streptomyces sp. AK02-01A]MDX3852717.1 acyltransferase domain-containing protein [Streptomyces sp. AK02-01A]
MQSLPAGGAMVAVEAGEAEAGPLVEDLENVSLAAVNGPSPVVLAGTEDEVERVAAVLAAQGRRTHRLRVSHAFHSPLMDPILDRFRQVVAGLRFGQASIPMVSALTGGPVGESWRTPEYWVRHAREAVRFADALHALHDSGASLFVELGPDSTLSALAQNNLGDEIVTVPVLRGDRDEESTLLTALALLHVNGVSPRWSVLFDGVPATRVPLRPGSG